MRAENKNTEILRHSAYITLDSTARARFEALASTITDWEDLVAQAEACGLSNILYSHLKSCGVQIPATCAISFQALTARHQRSNRERTKAMVEILDRFSEKNIEVILLKGMALIHNLYTDQCQRPMGDIDILVEPGQALLAQETLRETGYRAGDQKAGYLFDHHHLPIASRVLNGLLIQVEVHHNALSGDATSSITFDSVATSRIAISVQGRITSCLGHTDMLRHLCHHTFEPCEKIKLGAVADIYGYATKYFEEIDWQYLIAEQQFVTNTLRCLHFLTPLPDIVGDELGTPTLPAPSGVGRGFPPLTRIMINKNSASEKFRKLFICSDWWFHVFYQIPPGNSLVVVKLFRHPFRIGFWFLRRVLAKTKSRMQKTSP